MAEYNVTFCRYDSYTVEAENDAEAEEKAYKMYHSDCCSSVANTHYDEVEIEEIETEEEE